MHPAETLITEDQGQEHPGTDGIWTFIFIDMSVFLLMFLVYVSERARLPVEFAAAQHSVNPLTGLSSALVLLTSSWCMAGAVRAARGDSVAPVIRYLDLALLLGALFAANKIVEYSGKIGAGITPASNSFFGLYFVITCLHFAHVLGGMCFIAHCRMRLGAEGALFQDRKKLENVGLFWHFVDILWLFIFPTLYFTALA